MIGTTGAAHPPLEELLTRVAAVSDREANLAVDAPALVDGLLGEPATANVFLLGVAYQAGAVPVRAESIERAIEANGVAVDANRAAFDWGRQWVVDRGAVVEAAGAGTTDGGPQVIVDQLPPSLAGRVDDLGLDERLHDLVTMLAADLVAYQNRSYALRFVRLVNRVVGAERSVDRSSTELTEAAARGLHKLLAYKDEYEVARLLTGPEGRAAAREVGGRHATVRWRLHPPTLRALGRDRKIELDVRVASPAMRALARAKVLRGTRLDPFGRSEVRRTERAIVEEYAEVLLSICSRLTAAELPWATDLASSALAVRGYEQVKLASVDTFRRRLAEGRARLDSLPPVPDGAVG